MPIEENNKNIKLELIRNMAHLEFLSKKTLEGMLAGTHRSPFKGFSVDFVEHREYMRGDDIKHIDWKVFAKTDKLYIKEFEEKTELNCYFILDISSSMNYKTANYSKLLYSSYIIAILSYILLKQRDGVGLITFAEDIKDIIPPRNNPKHLNIILELLSKYNFNNPQGKKGWKTGGNALFNIITRYIKKRSLIILLSDFMTDINAFSKGIQYFTHQKHEVILFHILDPKEINLNFDKDYQFIDMETNEHINVNIDNIKKDYNTQLQNFIHFYKNIALKLKTDYELFTTDKDISHNLNNFLAKRIFKGKK